MVFSHVARSSDLLRAVQACVPGSQFSCTLVDVVFYKRFSATVHGCF